MAPVFDEHKLPLAIFAARGVVHYRRTVGPAIPCQVASPQSLTLFHQAGKSVPPIMRKRRSPSGEVVARSKAKTKPLTSVNRPSFGLSRYASR